jgi:hypothetical protein
MAPFNDPPIMNSQYATNGRVNGFTKLRRGDETPDLASRLHVERSEKAFGSRAVSLVDLPAGALFARISTATPGTKAYSSVQISENDHIELNSELVYCNHSCAPSLIFDMSKFEVRVVPNRDLSKGDVLTFWYPSSEWEMAQPFDCACMTKNCRGLISGAKDMDEQVLRQYWLNEHIKRMLGARNAM